MGGSRVYENKFVVGNKPLAGHEVDEDGEIARKCRRRRERGYGRMGLGKVSPEVREQLGGQLGIVSPEL